MPAPESTGGPVTEALVEDDLRIGSGNAGGLMRLSLGMTTQGGRTISTGRVGVESVDETVVQTDAEGGKTPMPGHELGTLGRIAMVSEPPDAELTPVGAR